MTITDFIPYGRENAISRQALAQLTGMDDRQVRRMIEDAWLLKTPPAQMKWEV